MDKIKASELILSDGKVYHLDLNPAQISKTIILVGDQFRVPKVSAFFDVIEHQVQKREFLCHTGTYNGKRLSVISTGIGTDNVDIVLNELDALFNLDLSQRCEKEEKVRLTLVRIGTCGSLQADVPVGDFVLSTGSFGLDNVAHFYELENSENEIDLLNAFVNHVRFPKSIVPYFTFADDRLNNLLEKNKLIHQGLTVTASGFYGPQGRKLRLPLKIIGLNDAFTTFQHKSHRIANFEMESSAIFALAKGMGHQAAAICLVLANRTTGEFLEDYEVPMNNLIEQCYIP